MPKHALAVLAAVLGAAPVLAQIVSYEGDTFPEEEGWERRVRPHPPERWLDNGRLSARCEVWDPEYCQGEDEFYRWDLDDFAGAQRFMLEWSVMTDGPRSEIPDVAPSSCVAAGQRGIWYHTTVARDQTAFLIDVRYTFWLDLTPDVPHEFRVDIYGEYWYEWSVDGEVRVAGRPEGQYPTADSFIIWGARAACVDSLTSYDFVRFGIPDDPEIDCDAIRRLETLCRAGKLKARLKSRLQPGTELTVTNNGDHRIMRVKPNGKAKAKYKNQTGEHTLLLLNCPAISQDITCGP